MTDHDQLFKKLLREFFSEFIELFLPQVALYLDTSEIKFLDKEIFAALASRDKRNADLVAQVRFKGTATQFLIHIEPESARRKRRGAFARRMFDYFAMLTRQSRLPVYPIALLSYDSPRDAESEVFSVVFPDKQILEFRFTIIQLNRLNWRDYLRHDNPVASALMVKMGFAPEERVEVKKECLRMIARLRLDRERSIFLSNFIDTYLQLNAQEEKQFHAEVEKLSEQEKEKSMELMSSWERREREIGLQDGLQQGEQLGELRLVLRLLEHRIGALSKRALASIKQLPLEQLENLGVAAADFKQASDLTEWLHAHSNGATNGHSSTTKPASKRKTA